MPEDERLKGLSKKLWLKYALDKAVAFFFLLLVSPLFLLLAFLIKLDGLIHPKHRGSVFYRETRVSEGQDFKIIKFRTVTEEVVREIHQSRGSRSITGSSGHTCAGRVILKWYLDELPQLWNVLKGEMSLVGPRPHIPVQTEEGFKKGWIYRKYLRAGILGVPQACKRHPRYQAYFEKMARTHQSDCRALNTLDGLYARVCLERSVFGVLCFDAGIAMRGLAVVLRGS